MAIVTDAFGTTTAFTITLASLANSSAGVGRQSQMVTGNTAQSALIAIKFTVGTAATANSVVNTYLIRSDGTISDDGAGTADAGITIVNAPNLGNIAISGTAPNTTYYGVFDTKPYTLGPNFGIAVVNQSGFAANGTTGQFAAEYTLVNPTIT